MSEFHESAKSRFRRTDADREYEQRRAEALRLRLARAARPQERNAQGHRSDCVCRTCFEAWRRARIAS